MRAYSLCYAVLWVIDCRLPIKMWMITFYSIIEDNCFISNVEEISTFEWNMVAGGSK